MRTKLRPFRFLQRFFPVWALRRQSHIVSRAFEIELRGAKNSDDRERIEYERYFELSEFEEAIQTIHSRRLIAAARELFVYIPEMRWEDGQYGGRFLDQESISRLHHAVKTQKDSIRDYRLKWITAITGVIGALIGLLAILKN